MSTASDREYLERRRNESIANAKVAVDPAVGRVHIRFAKGYAQALEEQRTPRRP